MKISICISTINRFKKLEECLLNINKSSFANFYEVVIVDQGHENNNIHRIKKIIPGIKYFKVKFIGKSKGLNFALTKASGDIIVFTDDDCIVDRNWLKNIYQSFQENKDVVGVFGKVLPHQPGKNKGEICPCTFLRNKKRVITKPCFHWENIGFGNNMAFKKEVYEKVGGFREWLGPGSIGSNAEDAEFALRLLIKGYKLLYNPEVMVYHNRWLSTKEFRKQCLSYSCGEVACYGYFAFQGKKFTKEVVINNFKDSYRKFRKAVKLILLFQKGSVKLLFENFEKLFFRLRGLLVGWYYSRKDPL